MVYTIFYTDSDGYPELVISVKTESKAKEFCDMMNTRGYSGIYSYVEMELV